MERIRRGFRFLGSRHRYTVCVNRDMDRDHFHITLFSNASKHLYPDNKIATFTIQLEQPVILGPFEIWEVGLCEISSPSTMQVGDNTNALVYCDLIAPQFIGSDLVRFLRAFNTTWPNNYYAEYIYNNVYYGPVEKRMFRDIRIEILNLTGERVAFEDSKTPLKRVLHFRRVITH